MSSILINFQKCFDIFNETRDVQKVVEFIMSLPENDKTEVVEMINFQAERLSAINQATLGSLNKEVE